MPFIVKLLHNEAGSLHQNLSERGQGLRAARSALFIPSTLPGSNIRLICRPEVATGALCCFIRFLPCASIFAQEVCWSSSRCDQSLELRQRREINLWPANAHVGANEGIHHPAGNRDDNARRAFHLEKLPSSALHPSDTNPQAEIGMPAIMNFPILADMGRMNGQWP
jgi:hypothetical protein